MENGQTRGRYSPEVRARSVRLVLDRAGDYGSQWEAIVSISAKSAGHTGTSHSQARHHL